MKKSTFLFSWAAIVSASIFIICWIAYAEYMRNQTQILFQETQLQGWNVSGAALKVSGFPGPHHLRWSGKIWRDSTIIRIPVVTLTGWPVPRSFFTLEAPYGFDVLESGEQILKTTLFRIKMEVPSDVPLKIDPEGMKGWQQRNGKINIAELSFDAGGVLAKGQGFFNLDNSLQPTGRLDFNLSNPERLLEIVHARTGDNFIYSLSKTFVESARKKDELGVDYVPMTVQIINRTVYLGPIRIAKLDLVTWGEQGNPLSP